MIYLKVNADSDDQMIHAMISHANACREDLLQQLKILTHFISIKQGDSTTNKNPAISLT